MKNCSTLQSDKRIIKYICCKEERHPFNFPLLCFFFSSEAFFSSFEAIFLFHSRRRRRRRRRDDSDAN